MKTTQELIEHKIRIAKLDIAACMSDVNVEGEPNSDYPKGRVVGVNLTNSELYHRGYLKALEERLEVINRRPFNTYCEKFIADVGIANSYCQVCGFHKTEH